MRKLIGHILTEMGPDKKDDYDGEDKLFWVSTFHNDGRIVHHKAFPIESEATDFQKLLSARSAIVVVSLDYYGDFNPLQDPAIDLDTISVVKGQIS